MNLLERLRFTELTRRKFIIASVFTAFLAYLLIAIVRFIGENTLAAEKRVLASVKVGIGRYAVESLSKERKTVYPQVLDDGQNTSASEKNPLFTSVLAYPGVTDGRWRKLTSDVYQGPSKSLYFYDNLSGDFSEKQLLSKFTARLLRLPDGKITGQLIAQLRSRAEVTFADGNRLIGGALVLLPKMNGRFLLKGEDRPERLFSPLSGTLDAEIAVKDFSAGGMMKFGYYSFEAKTQQLVLHEIFSGQEVPSVRSTFTVPSNTNVGFYFSIPGDIQENYFSQPEYNQDRLEHVRVFENPALRKITIAFDKGRSGVRLFQDMIVTVSY